MNNQEKNIFFFYSLHEQHITLAFCSLLLFLLCFFFSNLAVIPNQNTEVKGLLTPLVAAHSTL